MFSMNELFPRHQLRTNYFIENITPDEIFITWKGVCVMVFNTQSHEVASVLNSIHTSPDCDKFLIQCMARS